MHHRSLAGILSQTPEEPRIIDFQQSLRIFAPGVLPRAAFRDEKRNKTDREKREKLLASIAKFLKESPDRVPFSDWYQTDAGSYIHFRARSVQGGCFILLLKSDEYVER